MRPIFLKKLVTALFNEKIKRPILIEGSPGLGKTELAKQCAKELGVDCRVIHAPLLQPEDYGFPVVNASKTSVEFVISESIFPVEVSNCADSGILVIDELPQADASAQKILANLIQSRSIHGKQLKANWIIIATGNRAQDRAGANRILSHLGNRVTRIQFDASLDDWCQWALNNNVKPEVIAFARFKPDLLNNFDPANEVNATPRAWAEGISAKMGAIEAELEFEAFKGDVGEGPAIEFLSFLKVYRNLPNVDAILITPDAVEVPNDPATLFALTGALAYRANETNISRILQYGKRMPMEFLITLVRDALTRNSKLANDPAMLQFITSNKEFNALVMG